MSLFNLKSSSDDSYTRLINKPPFLNGNRLLFAKALFALVVIVSFTIKPTPAHASILSFILGNENATPPKEEVDQNSQTHGTALEAVVSPEAVSKDNIDTTIVSASALSSESGPLGTQADVQSGNLPTEEVSDGISIYVVRKNDSLQKIAKMFDVSANTILWANDLKKGSALTEGTTLVILPVSGVKYVLKKGDTLKSVAKKFKADIDEIGKFNGVTEDSDLVVGDTLIIPDGEINEPVIPRVYKTGSSHLIPGYGGPEYVGYYMRPIIGGRKTQGLHGHNGVDLANSIGTPIMASAAGTVIVSRGSGYNGGYGKYVVISHDNGTQTLYGHMNSVAVQSGDTVSQGQVIGSLGNTGKSTGPHVHFEIRGARNPF